MECADPIRAMEQVVGVEPTPSAWKAEVLAAIRYLHSKFLSRFLTYILYKKFQEIANFHLLLEGSGGIEPPRAGPQPAVLPLD